MGGLCPICENGPASSTEHVLPQWLLRDFDPHGPFTVEKDGVPLKRRDPEKQVSLEVVERVTMLVCEPCQAWLSQEFEDVAKEPVRSLLSGAAISGDEVMAAAKWGIKTLLLLGHPSAVFTQTGHRTDVDRSPFPASVALISEWRRNDRIPADLSLWLAASSSDASEVGVEHHASLLMPARITIEGGNTLEVSTKVFGLGTALPDSHQVVFHLLHHPSMDLENPWESEARIVRLWPDPPSTLDVAAIPTLDDQSRRNLDHWLIGGRHAMLSKGSRWSAAADDIFGDA